MSVQRSSFAVLAGITLFGSLTATPTLAESTQATNRARTVQHLTCVQDTQGLMCTIDETSKERSPTTSAQVTTTTPPEVTSSQQLEQISNLLLGLIYLGFPVGLVLAVLLRDRRDQAFAARVEQLERVWHQPSQFD